MVVFVSEMHNCHSELTRKLVELAKRDFLFLLGDSESINVNKTLSPTLSVGEGAKNEILRFAQNDITLCIDLCSFAMTKYCHSEGESQKESS